MPRVGSLFKSLKVKRVERLQERLIREQQNHFFACPSRCIRLDFEQASDFSFKCPECGELMSQEDNKKIIHDLEHEMKAIKQEIKAL